MLALRGHCLSGCSEIWYIALLAWWASDHGKSFFQGPAQSYGKGCKNPVSQMLKNGSGFWFSQNQLDIENMHEILDLRDIF